MIRKFSLVVVLVVALAGSLLAQPTDRLGKYAYASDEFIRAVNVSAYAIGDLFSSSTSRFLTFANVVKAKGSSGDVVAIEICIDTPAVAKVNFTLFSDTTSITLPADNAPLKITYLNSAYLVARIDTIKVSQIDSAGVVYKWFSLVSPFICKSNSTNLYGLLSMGAAYTPKTLGYVRVGLWIRRNQ